MLDEANEIPIDEELTEDEIAAAEFLDAQAEFYEHERQDRLWLRSCHAWIEVMNRPNRSEVRDRVQFAIDDAVIAACERAARIFRGDMPPVGRDYDPKDE